MAAFDTSRPTVVTSTGSIARLVSDLVAKFNTWNDARITRKSAEVRFDVQHSVVSGVP